VWHNYTMSSFDQMAEHRHIVGLDLVRFASAAMVMSFHLGFWSWAAPLGTIRRLMRNLPTFPELTLVAWPGWVGVEIFFVLSGFVIAYSAEGSSALAFFRSRFLRLMPAVWICASLVFAVLVAGNILLVTLRRNILLRVHFVSSTRQSFLPSRIFHGGSRYHKRSSLDPVRRLSHHAGRLRLSSVGT
jgi:peptidoglycan/LPS O-acetylase OafA/YrhL